MQERGPRCYYCEKFGHFARNCPQKQRLPRDDHSRQATQEDESFISTLIKRVRHMGVEARQKQEARTQLIGERTLTTVEVLGTEVKALIDSGSMISIVLLKVLVQAF